MAVPAAFENESLSEKVKRTIVDRVVDGTYPPGMRLVELQLAKEFGVSQAPVREALRELSSTGWSKTSPAAEPSSGPLPRMTSRRSISFAWRWREPPPRPLTRRLHADPSPLRQALAGMRDAAAANDAHGIAKYSTDFHRAVIAATGNRLMMEIWDSLYVEARTMATVVRGHVDLHAAAEAHVPILEAFENGTPELCTQLVIEHQHEYSILPQE